MKRNPSHPDRGDERLPHTVRSGSQRRMLARGVEATNACPTLHGRVVEISGGASGRAEER
jgi:hypothetical protein